MRQYFPSLSHKVAEKEKNNGYCKAFCIIYKRNNKSCKNISVKSFLAFNVLKLNQKQILQGPKKLLVSWFGCTLTKCCILYPRFNDIPENNLMLNVFIHSIRGNISFFKKWATVTAEPDFPHTYFIKNKHNQKPIDRETTLLSYCLLKHINIVNLSTSGTESWNSSFPNELKNAIISPLYKKKDRHLIYRQVKL